MVVEDGSNLALPVGWFSSIFPLLGTTTRSLPHLFPLILRPHLPPESHWTTFSLLWGTFCLKNVDKIVCIKQEEMCTMLLFLSMEWLLTRAMVALFRNILKSIELSALPWCIPMRKGIFLMKIFTVFVQKDEPMCIS